MFQPGKAMKEVEDELNLLGKDGWEVVIALPVAASFGFAGVTKQIKVFLKRPKT
jgi:hypothetical protein